VFVIEFLVADFMMGAHGMLHELVDAALLHTAQARAFMQLMCDLAYSWPYNNDEPARRSLLLLPLLQQLQRSIRDVYAAKPASDGSSSGSSKKRMSAQAAATLIQLQSAFVSLAEFCIEDVQCYVGGNTVSAVEAARGVPLFEAMELLELCLQTLAGACCCWHRQQLHWQQQQQGQAQQQHQQQQQQLPLLQRTRLCRRMLQLRGSDTVAPKVLQWGVGDYDLLHFPADACAEYTQAVWHSRQQRSSTDLLDRGQLLKLDDGASTAIRLLTLQQQAMAEEVRAVLPAEVQLTADAVLLLYWRLQEVEGQQQQSGQPPKLILSAASMTEEGRLLDTIQALQQLLDLQLAAAARSIAAGAARQSPQWAWKSVLLASVIEVQRTVAAAAAASAAGQSSSNAQGAAGAAEKPSACAQRLLQRLSKVLGNEGELQADMPHMEHLQRRHNIIVNAMSPCCSPSCCK
jgi:hypothetical protein